MVTKIMLFFYFCSLPITILSGFRVAAIGLPTLEYTLFEKPQGWGQIEYPPPPSRSFIRVRRGCGEVVRDHQ